MCTVIRSNGSVESDCTTDDNIIVPLRADMSSFIVTPETVVQLAFYFWYMNNISTLNVLGN